MLAQGPSGRISYPGIGRTWQEVGVEQPLLQNLSFPAPGSPPTGRCFGWAPTLVGSGGRDILQGTPGHDVILSGEGNDTIHGEEGEDRICTEGGSDLLVGGGHPDHIDGGKGEDRCYQGEVNGLENAAPGNVFSCEHPSYTLTVDTAGKLVTSKPPGISCPDDCEESYVTHTTVTLTAVPVGLLWAGCDTSPASPACVVTMSHDRTVRV
jgi:hypothetical protein